MLSSYVVLISYVMLSSCVVLCCVEWLVLC